MNAKTLSQLEAENLELTKQLSSLTARADADATRLTEVEADRTHLKESINSLTSQLEASNSEVISLKAAAKTAEQRAIEIAAQAGRPPISDEDATTGKNKEQDNKPALRGRALLAELWEIKK